MVVDDTPGNLRLLGAVLNTEGYRVQAFPRAAMALAAVKKSPPDIILLDINMPEMNGYEMCEQLKASSETRDIPVIMLSALTDSVDKVRGFAVGAADYVTKPFEVDELNARIRTHLDLRAKGLQIEEANRALRALEAARDNLVQMVVHDLRSPLSAILSNLDYALRTPLPGDTTEALSESLEAGRGLAKLIDSLLEVSRMEATEMVLDQRPVDLAVLVKAVSVEFEPLLKGRSLVVHGAESPVVARCDPPIIRRVLQNLLGNAIKFTERDLAVIEVHVKAEGPVFRVVVTDNGPGIAIELQTRIFDKFFQGDDRIVRETNSTGLGLAFCKLAIESHGGRIGVSSDLGRGSSFWFELNATA